MSLGGRRSGSEEDNEILIDVEVEGEDEFDETHDSQMVSQVMSDVDNLTQDVVLSASDDDGEDDEDRVHPINIRGWLLFLLTLE